MNKVIEAVEKSIFAKLIVSICIRTFSEIMNDIPKNNEHIIARKLPRVKLLDVSSIPNYDNNEYNVVITYQIIGAEV